MRFFVACRHIALNADRTTATTKLTKNTKSGMTLCPWCSWWSISKCRLTAPLGDARLMQRLIGPTKR
jgi:hypothetical protein